MSKLIFILKLRSIDLILNSIYNNKKYQYYENPIKKKIKEIY